ncbi:hypothetical protein F4604DRAFT_1884768 [Suillus subluteus]|nr:hypothetical protein F4604DRAFT_1884768 [Suillus subluteus]
MSLDARLDNVLQCLQQNGLSAAEFISAVLNSRDALHADVQESLTMNVADICSMPNSRVSVFAWATTFVQHEMDLGELGGDEPDVGDDEEEEDNRTYLDQPKKRQRRAAQRNIVLQTIKAVVIISICLQSTNERCNCLQGWMGIFMKSTCVPEKVVEVMAHAGLSISLSAICNAVASISEEISCNIKKEVCTLCTAFAYDNFDIAFITNQPTLENRSSFVSATSATVIPLHGVDESNADALRCSATMWACDPKNPSPTSFLLMNEMRSFLSLHKRDTCNRQTNPTQPSPRELAFAWHVRTILVHYGQNFEHFLNKLGEPEAVQRIPVHKTNQIPCRSMDIKQSTTDRNSEVLDELFQQGGIGDERESGFNAGHDVDMSEHVILVHRDLLTKE